MVYIAGKISADTPEEEEANLKRFYEIEKEFLDEGLDVHNPARYKKRGKVWEHYLAIDSIFLVRNQPDMFFLKGWEESLGARLEHEIAKNLKLKISYE
jgi:hypothetical protein